MGNEFRTPISDGVVATVSVTLSGSNDVPVTIGNSLGASLAGDAIAVTGTGGTVSVTAVTVISSLACSPGTLAPNASSTCTVILSGSGGGIVGLSSSSTNLTVPASLTIPTGSVSGTFLATAKAFTADQTATVTATLNGSSATATSLPARLCRQSHPCSAPPPVWPPTPAPPAPSPCRNPPPAAPWLPSPTARHPH